MALMTACPTCAGPVEFDGAIASFLVGYEVMPEQFSKATQDVATRAMWAAVKSLEDAASQARWRLAQPSPPESLWRVVVESERDADVLRRLLSLRTTS